MGNYIIGGLLIDLNDRFAGRSNLLAQLYKDPPTASTPITETQNSHQRLDCFK